MPLLSRDTNEFDHVLRVCKALDLALSRGRGNEVRIHTRQGTEIVGAFVNQSFFTARSVNQVCSVGGELTVLHRGKRVSYDLLDVLRITPVL